MSYWKVGRGCKHLIVRVHKVIGLVDDAQDQLDDIAAVVLGRQVQDGPGGALVKIDLHLSSLSLVSRPRVTFLALPCLAPSSMRNSTTFLWPVQAAVMMGDRPR